MLDGHRDVQKRLVEAAGWTFVEIPLLEWLSLKGRDDEERWVEELLAKGQPVKDSRPRSRSRSRSDSRSRSRR